MIRLQGKSASPGVAVGPLYYYKTSRRTVPRRIVKDTEAEWARFKDAQKKTVAQLAQLTIRARVSEGSAVAQLFETHQMLAEDLDLEDAVHDLILVEHLNCEAAVADVAEQFAEMFAEMDDAYMQGRAADVRDVTGRLLNILMGTCERTLETDHPVILVADDLAPSETLQLDKSKILAILTRYGSVNSHTAILARTMGIPAIVALGDVLGPTLEGCYIMLDGESGEVVLDADEATQAALLKKQAEEQRLKRLLEALKGKENVTLDGQHMDVYCNIASLQDIEAVMANDGGGIGLFRSETLFLQSSEPPTEDAQFRTYRGVLSAMEGKRVVIRTLDIGADKQVNYLHLHKEPNPALGMRAVRLCLTRPDLMQTQLRALYRASVYGNLAIMFPMIISVREVQRCREMCLQVQADLEKEGIPFDPHVELGIMIETPAAVMISDRLAREADFFSIGTNDLTQYLLACDRQAEDLDEFYDAHHPALLRAIRMVTDNAHRHGKRVSICGELAGDVRMTETFLALGVDSLSVTPSRVLPLRNSIRMIDAFRVRNTILESLAE